VMSQNIIFTHYSGDVEDGNMTFGSKFIKKTMYQISPKSLPSFIEDITKNISVSFFLDTLY